MNQKNHRIKEAKQRVQILLQRIDRSPSPIQATEVAMEELRHAGFSELSRENTWHLQGGGSYVVNLGGSAWVAFRLAERADAPFHLVGAHSDSPAYRVKAQPEISREGFRQLNVEPYGGVIERTWLDRPLSLAGRLVVRDASPAGFHAQSVVVDRDWLLLPSLAIHMDREVNQKGEINSQKVMQPVVSLETTTGSWLDVVAEAAGVAADQILDYDLILYAREKGCLLGQAEEFFSVGRIDNLGMAFCGLDALVEAKPSQAHQVLVVNDHEEIGSGSWRGANSATLSRLLARIACQLGLDPEAHEGQLARSFLISCDQAHAVHPNYPEVADPTNRPRINQGPVIKFAANRSYTSEAMSAARFRLLAESLDIPVQSFHNRSDRRGGSTIGPLAERWTTISGVDVGNPMLSMHSVREFAGTLDHQYLFEILRAFYEQDTEGRA